MPNLLTTLFLLISCVSFAQSTNKVEVLNDLKLKKGHRPSQVYQVKDQIYLFNSRLGKPQFSVDVFDSDMNHKETKLLKYKSRNHFLWSRFINSKDNYFIMAASSSSPYRVHNILKIHKIDLKKNLVYEGIKIKIFDEGEEKVKSIRNCQIHYDSTTNHFILFLDIRYTGRIPNLTDKPEQNSFKRLILDEDLKIISSLDFGSRNIRNNEKGKDFYVHNVLFLNEDKIAVNGSFDDSLMHRIYIMTKENEINDFEINSEKKIINSKIAFDKDENAILLCLIKATKEKNIWHPELNLQLLEIRKEDVSDLMTIEYPDEFNLKEKHIPVVEKLEISDNEIFLYGFNYGLDQVRTRAGTVTNYITQILAYSYKYNIDTGNELFYLIGERLNERPIYLNHNGSRLFFKKTLSSEAFNELTKSGKEIREGVKFKRLNIPEENDKLLSSEINVQNDFQIEYMLNNVLYNSNGKAFGIFRYSAPYTYKYSVGILGL